MVLREDSSRQSRGDAEQAEARRGLPHQGERERPRRLLSVGQVGFYKDTDLLQFHTAHVKSGRGSQESRTLPLPPGQASVLPPADRWALLADASQLVSSSLSFFPEPTPGVGTLPVPRVVGVFLDLLP